MTRGQNDEFEDFHEEEEFDGEEGEYQHEEQYDGVEGEEEGVVSRQGKYPYSEVAEEYEQE